MPLIYDSVKSDIYIDSIEDIPEKYRKIVINKADEELTSNYIGNRIPGKRGEAIFSLEQIGEEFNDDELIYYGHGTNADSHTIDKILNEGLLTKSPEVIRGYVSTLRGLESTTVCFGEGSKKLFTEQEYKLDHWPHKEAHIIIIVALPKNYVFVRGALNSHLTDPYKQFYVGSEEEGYLLRPEFIKGVYDSISKSFIPNEKFFQKLSETEKKEFFEELDNNYIHAYSENICLPPEKFNKYNSAVPISDSKMDELYIEWYSNQLRKLNDYELSKKKNEENNSVYDSRSEGVVRIGSHIWDVSEYDLDEFINGNYMDDSSDEIHRGRNR